MKIFNAILGLYAVLSALYCIFWPEESLFSLGWTVTIFLALWSIAAIAEYFISKKQVKGLAAGGASGLVLGIIAMIVSILSMRNDTVGLIFSIIIILCLAFAIAVKGIAELAGNRKGEHRGAAVVAGVFHLLAGLFGIIALVFLQDKLTLSVGIMLAVIGVAEFISVFGNDTATELSEIW